MGDFGCAVFIVEKSMSLLKGLSLVYNFGFAKFKNRRIKAFESFL